MISFTAAHVSLIVLRIKEPDLERPWRVPFNIRVKGRLLPLTAIIGGLGTAAVWVVIVSFQSGSRVIGFLWFGVGLLMYLTYRRAKGYSLTETVATTMMPESMQADVDYHQILVPIVGSHVTDVMMVLACQLATEKKSSIDGLYVIEVPLNLPLDAKLTRERAKADETLKAAALIASQFKVKFTPHIVALDRPAGPSSKKPHSGAPRSSSSAPYANGVSETRCSGAPATTFSTTPRARCCSISCPRRSLLDSRASAVPRRSRRNDPDRLTLGCELAYAPRAPRPARPCPRVASPRGPRSGRRRSGRCDGCLVPGAMVA